MQPQRSESEHWIGGSAPGGAAIDGPIVIGYKRNFGVEKTQLPQKWPKWPPLIFRKKKKFFFATLLCQASTFETDKFLSKK